VTPAGGASDPEADGLLAVGGIDYGRDDVRPTPPPALDPTLLVARPRSAPLDPDEARWGPLPGTAAEADAIAALFRRGVGGPTETLSGPRATKGALRAALPGKRYLHLATHGYFADPKYKSALAPTSEPTGLASFEGMSRAEAAGWYPGLLSGLVWAGANAPPTDPATGALDRGAGIMTAEEVAGLDLSACELAVLSACETGLGRVAGGEGGLGLQRAFHQAGARHVVASLWKVDDEATRALMTRFYEHLWREKLSVPEALRRAQLDLLEGRIAAPEADSRTIGPRRPSAGQAAPAPAPGWAHPRLWAAWVLSGVPTGMASAR
jgi:CHAT domain-containing protein